VNCNNIKEWILTDYTDNELTADKRRLVEMHLKDCLACRNFSLSVKETAGAVTNIQRVSLDQEKIWQQIRTEIDQEKSPSLIYKPRHRVSIWEKIFLRPAYAGAGMALVVLLTIFYFHRLPGKMAKQQEKVEDIQYLSDVVKDLALDESEGDSSSSSLEEYFL